MIVLVDKEDNEIGTMEKIEAHEKALLHRAFSVFIFNSAGKMLLQQRAFDKYHSGGLWTNTCCSHPFPNESVPQAALRRLKEEMGLEARLEYLFWFEYMAPFDNGLTEHEIDHVYIGFTDELPAINPQEVADYTYLFIHEIQADIERNPEKYTVWFRIIFNRFLEEELPVIKSLMRCG